MEEIFKRITDTEAFVLLSWNENGSRAVALCDGEGYYRRAVGYTRHSEDIWYYDGVRRDGLSPCTDEERRRYFDKCPLSDDFPSESGGFRVRVLREYVGDTFSYVIVERRETIRRYLRRVCSELFRSFLKYIR